MKTKNAKCISMRPPEMWMSAAAAVSSPIEQKAGAAFG